MSRASWSPEDHKEYEAALEEAFEAGTTTTERIDALEAILADAVQAHRPWARDIEREAIRTGLDKLIVSHGNRRQPPVLFVYDGRVISKPRRRGVVTRLDSGERVHQQELFEVMTWDEFDSLDENRADQIGTLVDERRMLGRIRQLRQLHPDSTTVGEALHLQGCSLDEWVAGEVTA
jgi:hypothetical protein